MKWDQTYVSGIGTWIPDIEPTSTAVAEGRYDAEAREADGYEGTCIEREKVAVEMAAEAGRRAVAAAGLTGQDIDMVFHGGLWFQGVDMWPSASYVAANAAHSGAVAFDLQQQCNAGLSGLELAARLVQGLDGHILVTTADRFRGDRLDRWRTETGIVYGDGAGAMVVSRGGGMLRLVSTHTQAANELEAVVRGPAFAAEPPTGPIDIQSRFDHFISTGGMREAAGTLMTTVSTAIRRALEDADSSIEDMTRVIVPSAGRSKLDWQLRGVIPVAIERTNWKFAAQMGHLGASDQTVGLERCVAEGALSPGDRVLLVGSGAGFTCTCAVLEWVDHPDRSDLSTRQEEVRS